MRIALVGLTYPFRGGIAHYTTLLCASLRERHDVIFLSLKRQYPSFLFPGRTQTDPSSDTLQVENEPILDPVNPVSWLLTARRIGAFRPDLVLFSWWHPYFAPSFGTVGLAARRCFNIPTCFLCHNVIPHERSAVDTFLLNYAFASADGFITHSESDTRVLRKLKPMKIVHTGHHPTYAHFAPAGAPDADRAKEKLGIAGRKVVLFFGFIRDYKGLKILLEAMNLLPDTEGYHALVVGEFYDDRANYEPALGTLVRSARLTLVDRYVSNEEVPTYFSAADLVVLPYLSATQSGVIQMAYGFHKPVVASAVGGIPDAVEDGKTGYLVPPNDARAVADAVIAYFNTADRSRMTEAIRAAQEGFSWSRMVDAVESVADQIPGRDLLRSE